MENANLIAQNPRTRPILDLTVVCLAGIGLRLLLPQAMRLHAESPASLTAWGLALAAALAAAALLWAFIRVFRRREDWALYLGAAVLFILLYKVGKNRPEISSLELPLAIFSLAPAGLLAWAFVRRIRQADELGRHILYEALAVSFVVQFVAMVIYAFLEGLGLARPPSILWALLLLTSWSVGLAVSSWRYQ